MQCQVGFFDRSGVTLITLEDTSKENIKKVIDQLYTLYFVKRAFPNYTLHDIEDCAS